MVLDPTTAYQVRGQGPIRSTVFTTETLLVRGWHEETVGALEQVAKDAGFRLKWDSRRRRDREMLQSSGSPRTRWRSSRTSG